VLVQNLQTRSRNSIEGANKKFITVKLVNKWSRFYNKAKIKWDWASQKWDKENKWSDDRFEKKTFASEC